MAKRTSIVLLVLMLAMGCSYRSASVPGNGDLVLGAKAFHASGADTARPTPPAGGRFAEVSSKSSSYIACRWRDLMDIPELRAGFGSVSFLSEADVVHDEDVWLLLMPPLLIPEVDVEATCLAGLALHGGARYMWGISDGCLKRTYEGIWGFPWSNLLVSSWEGWRGLLICYWHYDLLERERQYGFSPVPLVLTYNEKDHRFGIPSVLPWYPSIRWADVRIGITTLPVACSVGISPGETIDFVVGWFGFDPSGDDENQWK